MPSERPVHKVVFEHEFLLSATEITQGQFFAVTGRNLSWFKGDLKQPVETVSWYDAIEFCNELSVREGRSPRYANVLPESRVPHSPDQLRNKGLA